MPFEFLEDSVTSDITFHAWGATTEELFTAAADATTQVMVASLDSVRPAVRRTAVVIGDDLELLLWNVLEELVFLKDAERLLLRLTQIKIERADEDYRARIELAGEPIAPDRHQLAADVKAITVHGLRVEQRDGAWHAQVTVDV